MKLYDMHVHTRGISKCSRLSREELCQALKEDGSDGMVLTNHYAPHHVDRPFETWLEKYEQEYELTKEEAKQWGLKTLFGIEVTLGGRGVQDFLLYGVKPSCLYESDGPLWEYSLKELYEFAHEKGGVFIHAHPFRNGSTPADYRYLDGVEINCHPLYGTNCREEVSAYAKEHGLIMTCGSDYHGDVYKAHCGVWLPDDLETEEQLGAYLRRGQPELLIHDIDRARADATCTHRVH